MALGCRAKPQPVLFPVGPAMPEAFIQEYVSQGDKLFLGMHLHAWRRAEEAYARAFSLAPRQEIRDKLSLTRLLRMTREIDEDFACPTMTEDIDFICRETPDGRAQALCDLARAYAAGPAAAAREMKRVDPSLAPGGGIPPGCLFLHAPQQNVRHRPQGRRPSKEPVEEIQGHSPVCLSEL